MDKELKAIFENVDKDILSEDVLTQISSLIQEKVDSRVTLELENALKQMDEDHATQLTSTLKTFNEDFDLHQKAFPNIIKMIDEDHVKQVKKVLEAIDKDHAQKLQFVKNQYEKLLKEAAIKHRDSIVESVDKFLDIYIDKAIPAKQIEEAAKNTLFKNLLNEARTVLGIDEAVVKGNLKEAIFDGKATIDKQSKEIAALKKELAIRESKEILAEKTAHLPAEVAKFVRSRFEGKSAQTIKENFDYVISMFERKESKDRHSHINESRNVNVDRNKVADELTKNTEIVAENTSGSKEPYMSMYLEGMNFRK